MEHETRNLHSAFAAMTLSAVLFSGPSAFADVKPAGEDKPAAALAHVHPRPLAPARLEL